MKLPELCRVDLTAPLAQSHFVFFYFLIVFYVCDAVSVVIVHSIVSDFTSNKQCMPCENISGKTLTSQLFTLSKITLGAQFCCCCTVFQHSVNRRASLTQQPTQAICKMFPFSQFQCQLYFFQTNRFSDLQILSIFPMSMSMSTPKSNVCS